MGDRIAVFNQGVLEQVGEPMALYQQPSNRFVAQFLGSPRMNVMPGTLVSGSACLSLRMPGLADIALVDSPAFDADACRSVGVRPEALEIGPPGEGHWSLPVELVERLGDTTLVYLRLPGGAEPLCVKLSAATAPCSVGDIVGVRPARHALHAFDASGRCLGTV